MSLPRSLASRTFSFALLAAAVVGVLAWNLARAANARAAESEAMAAVAPLNDTIKKSMEQMNDALKALSKGVTAENRDASLAELAKFESALIAAKAETPESAAKVEEKKRPAFVADFKKNLVEALKLAADAEIAILDGKYKDADTLIRNKVSAMKSTGHGKFKPEGGGK